jgi:hypothetical protein
MSNELFDIAFSGQISEGADPAEVKARIGKMFNAQGAKLDQLFSGKRIVIKRNVDEATAQKFVSAFLNAGAVCEARSTSPAPAEPATPQAAAAPVSAPSSASAPPPDAGAPPSTDPLGVTAEQIGDLGATLAPVGDELQDEVKAVPEPQYDLSALEMAPVGSTLSEDQKEPPPPLPDTSGLSLVDDQPG